MNDIPKEWQLEPHYEPGLYWLSREPRPIKLFGKELPAKESVEYPGWYFLQRGEPMRIVDSLEEALAALKSRLKHWNMIDLLGRPAPIEASKSVRKQMVIDLLNAPIATPPPDYDPDRDEPFLLLSCKWELGDYLLVASIDYTPFRPEFSTRFGQPNNPIRSLVGRVCTLRAMDFAQLDEDYPDDLDDLDEDDLEPLELLEDDEDLEFEEEEEPDWQEIAVGPVSLEGNRLTVGFWSCTFDENTEVTGVAYEEAVFDDEKKSYHLFVRRSNDRT
ncbi:hypothetical protein [Meiothermus taiwanensis]|jgi:hypothetical protein|uniref:Uncharacterized protein n=3 Tax=Meiothermus taiwanensis TaxID=172827 RepID=A0A399E4G5_9DEIN|nr:hypothetical protein [Meiothermus taiwanensis]AWR87401.1 hypothetical protein Mtai_v1c21690 [Meiothermus taiwanensis WR-220]KIQ55959.1 hypothetical protein SY28_00830 [Meiothermus taiwanensis]RIH79624.1 hypothetical protein Mcate_00263 [Meiothermus taiwanensis]